MSVKVPASLLLRTEANRARATHPSANSNSASHARLAQEEDKPINLLLSCPASIGWVDRGLYLIFFGASFFQTLLGVEAEDEYAEGHRPQIDLAKKISEFHLLLANQFLNCVTHHE